jgi:hypothetical protein
MNIFEQAARRKYRFPSAKGELTVEQLWDLPLIAAPRAGTAIADLDSIARGIAAELRGVTSESFVETKPDPRKGDLETKLEVLKHVIAAKQADAAAAKTAAERAEKRRKLVDAIAAKDEQAIQNMSKEELLKQLAEIDGAQ